jgi:hypothetical protein
MSAQSLSSLMETPTKFETLQTLWESDLFNCTAISRPKSDANWLANFGLFERFELMGDSVRKRSHHFLIAMHLSMHITPISLAAPARHAIGQPREQRYRSLDFSFFLAG